MDPLDEVGAGQVQRFFRDGLALVLEQAGGFGSEDLFNGWHNALLYLRVRQLLHGRFLDRRGDEVVDRQGDHRHLVHTYLRAVGIDSSGHFDVAGRKFPIADPAYGPIEELLA